jgi:hypothetical protein
VGARQLSRHNSAERTLKGFKYELEYGLEYELEYELEYVSQV